jgi:hypothetical protein
MCTQGVFKLIERRKVEGNVKEFVRHSIRKHLMQPVGPQ